jgi:hypothetical protein
MIIFLYILGVEPVALMEGAMFQYIDSFRRTYKKEKNKGERRKNRKQS